MTTHNGFSRVELVRDMEINMNKRVHEKTCCQMAELCSHTHGITTHLSYLCDYYSKFCLHGNMWLAKRLALGIKEIIVRRSVRKLPYDADFQRRVCELTMLLSITPIKHHTKLNNPKYAGYLSVVEPLMYSDATMKFKRNVDDVFKDILTSDMLRMFNVMYYLVKTDSRKELIVLLNYLTVDGLEGVIQIPKRLPEGVKPIEAGDMVWPLWHLVFEFPVNPDVTEYLENLWYLFGHGYKHAKRTARMNILFMAYMAVIKPGSLEDRVVKDPIISIAIAKIRVAFGDVLKIDFTKHDEDLREKEERDIKNNDAKVAKKAALAKKREEAKPVKVKVKAGKRLDGNEEALAKNPLKYEYLKFYTNVKDPHPILFQG